MFTCFRACTHNLYRCDKIGDTRLLLKMNAFFEIFVVYLVLSTTFSQTAATTTRYIYEIYNRSTDWKTANEICEMIGTEDLCSNGICHAEKIKDLLPNHNFTDTHGIWVQIYYKMWNWLEHECLAYYYPRDQHTVTDPDFQKSLGAIYIEKNSPANCANVCGYGIKAVYLWGTNCYCNNTGLKRYDVNTDPSNTIKNKSRCSAQCPGSNFQLCGGLKNPFNYPLYVSKYSIDISDDVNKPLNNSVGAYCVAAEVSVQKARFVRVTNCNMKKTTVCKRHSVQEKPVPVTEIVTRMWTTEALGTDGPSSAVSSSSRISDTTMHVWNTNLSVMYSTRDHNITEAYTNSHAQIGIYVGAALGFLVVICLIVIAVFILKRRRQKSTHNVIFKESTDENRDQSISLLSPPTSPTSTQNNVINDNVDYSYSYTTVNKPKLDNEVKNSTHTEVEGQYDHLNSYNQSHRDSMTSKDSTYDHAGMTSRDMTTYDMAESRRKIKPIETNTDSVYDHTNDTTTYDISGDLTVDVNTDNEYEYTKTGNFEEPFNVKPNQ